MAARSRFPRPLALRIHPDALELLGTLALLALLPWLLTIGMAL